MPKAAPLGGKLASALAGQLRARNALEEAMKLQEITQKMNLEAMPCAEKEYEV